MDRTKSSTSDGIRRCQRLPELAHPVDFARPDPRFIKSRAREILPESRKKPRKRRFSRPIEVTR